MRELLDSYLSFPRFFTIAELSNYFEPFVRIENFKNAIAQDDRYIHVSKKITDESIFISKRVLFNWFSFLSYDLSKANVYRLSSRKLALLLSSLRINERWYEPPEKVVSFGKKYGFITDAWSDDQYIFPLSYILAGLSSHSTEVAYKYFHFLEDWDSLVDQEPITLIRDELGVFDDRTIQIIFGREGLSKGGRKTLEELGINWQITRERVRQIEEKFWKRIHHPGRSRILIKPFLCDFMRRKGALIIDLNSNEASWRIFIAKCAKIPMQELYGNFLILGANSEDIECFKFPIKYFGKEVTIEDLADCIDTKIQPCLSRQELKLLCRFVKRLLIKQLTKRQKVYYSLRSLGKPSHYSRVAEEYWRLFPEDEISEHSVHSILGGRAESARHGFVWIGTKGTYALKEWGYERPEKRIFDRVEEIVKEIYSKTKRAVPMTVIAAELGKYRKIVNYSSLYFATYFNSKLHCVHKDFFIPKRSKIPKADKNESVSLDQALREFKKEIGT